VKRIVITGALLLALSTLAQAREAYEARPGLLYPGGLVLFLNSQAPMSYESYSRGELPTDAVLLGEVTGQGCQYGISLPLSLLSGTRAASLSGAAGNGGYKKAIHGIHAQYPQLRGLYDVKIDLHATIVLGIFSRLCTEIDARGFR
jgi:hypothetical protein